MNRESATAKPKETSSKDGFSVGDLHDRIQSKLNELHADFRQLRSDIRAANQSGERARKDRIDGFKRALRDMLESVDRADREWK